MNIESVITGFVKRAEQHGCTEDQALDLFKKAAFNASSGLGQMFKTIALPKAMQQSGKPQVPQLTQAKPSPMQQMGQNAPPALRPVQPNLQKQLQPQVPISYMG